MEQNTEQKLRLENDITNLNRDRKHALESLTRVKVDVTDLLSLKEKITNEIELRHKELNDVLNDISGQKIAWAQERNEELKELENKQSEADNVLKRKKELNEQEEKIRNIESETIKVRNETRELDFKLGQERTALEVKENEIKNWKKMLEQKEQETKKNKDVFKEKIVKILEEIHNT